MKTVKFLFTALILASFCAFAQETAKHHDQPQADKDMGAKGKMGVRVICYLCSDLTMDKSEAVVGEYEGKTVYFCSESEKEPFAKEPTKYILATDPLTGKAVDKTTAKFTYDQPVKYVNKKGIERKNTKRYFFESKKSMRAFKAHPDKYVTGKYTPIPESELAFKKN